MFQFTLEARQKHGVVPAFPFEMLSNDQAWPAAEDDAKAIRALATQDRIIIGNLPELIEVQLGSMQQPDLEKWEASGWKATTCLNSVPAAEEGLTPGPEDATSEARRALVTHLLSEHFRPLLRSAIEQGLGGRNYNTSRGLTLSLLSAAFPQDAIGQ